MIKTYVAGDTPRMLMETRIILMGASDHHRELWGNLTIEKIDAAFADWGPRRHLKIDWSKVKGHKP